jgi:serine/threonine protein kinase
VTVPNQAFNTTKVRKPENGSLDNDRLRSVLAGRSLTLDRELGRGGMSIVYLARDLRHNRLVAVKVLRPGVPMGAERFLREIETISPLAHPNIVPLFDSGIADGTPYFVMPYIEGESLRRRLRREGRLEIADAVRIAGEIGGALQFAHEKDILHRDIKPENILLEAGHAVVTDFGVAGAVSGAAAATDSQRLTDHGMILGTAEYMSPEQASGDRALDGRTDIYSLGCVLYEMLTGAPPFTGESPREVLARRFRELPRPVRDLRPEVSPRLQAVVERATAADPADRFATTSDFLAALRSPADPPPGAGRLTRGRTRLRWSLALGGAAAVVALASHETDQPRFDPQRIVVARLSNETGDSSFSYLSPLATDHLTASLAGVPGIIVVTSASVMPSRVTSGLRLDSLDDPERLHALAQETAAGTVVSGSYFRSGDGISFRAEITDANHGALLDAVGPVTSPVDRPAEAMDSLSRDLESAIGRHLHTGSASSS